MSFIYMRMKSDFHIKGWAPTLVLNQRPGGTRKWPIASCKTFQDSLGLDSRYRIPDSLSMKLRFWISMFSGIPDSVSWIPDSKAQDSEFHCKKFQYYIGIRNSLNEENDTIILSKPQLLLQLVCMSLPFLPEWLDEVGTLWCWLFPKLEVVKLQIALANSVEELGLKMWILDS